MQLQPLSPYQAPPGAQPLRASGSLEAPLAPVDRADLGLPEATRPAPLHSLLHLVGATGLGVLTVAGGLVGLVREATAGSLEAEPPLEKPPTPAKVEAAPVQAAPEAPEVGWLLSTPVTLPEETPALAPEPILPGLELEPLLCGTDGPLSMLLEAPPPAEPRGRELLSLLREACPDLPEPRPAPQPAAKPKAAKGDFLRHGVNFSHLITDQEFQDANAMTVEEVQAFLDASKSGLAKYSEGGRSAAQIVVDAAQEHRVNPAVILTTLEKEVGLVSYRAKPSGWRAASAMGYAYTDGGSRPSGSSFAWQVDRGTALLRELFDEGSAMGFPAKKSVDYGARTLTVRNAATWALVRYTPHTTDTRLRVVGGGNYNFRTIYERFSNDRVELYEKSLADSQVATRT